MTFFKHIAISTEYHSFYIRITNGSEQGVFSGQIFCPFSATQHPQVEEIQEELNSYFVSHGSFEVGSPEMEKFVKSKMAYLAGYMCSDDTKEDTLLVAKHIGWLFDLDNKTDGAQSEFRQNEKKLCELVKILKETLSLSLQSQTGHFVISVDLPDGFLNYRSLVDVNMDIGSKLRNKDKSKNILEFQWHYDKYLQSLCKEAYNRSHQLVMTTDTYKELRKYSSAVNEVLEFIWTLQNIKLNESIRENIEFMSLMRQINLFVSYVNDLFSLNNEISEDTQENIVRVLQNNRKISLGEAIQETVRLINEACHDFFMAKDLFLRSSFVEDDDKEEAKIAIGYAERLMVGNLEWSNLTGLYKEAELE